MPPFDLDVRGRDFNAVPARVPLFEVDLRNRSRVREVVADPEYRELAERLEQREVKPENEAVRLVGADRPEFVGSSPAPARDG